MIEEDYVSFELAKMLKEKGFDEYCSHFYRLDGEHEYCWKAKLPRLTNNDIRNHDDWVNRVFACTCPTLQMAMKWLKENYHLHMVIIPIKPYVCDNDKMVPSDKVAYVAKIVRIDKWYKYLEDFDTLRPSCQSESESEVIENAIKYCLQHLI